MSRRHWFTSLLTAVAMLGAVASQAHAGRFSSGLERFIAGKAGDEQIRVLAVLKDQAPISTMDHDLHNSNAPMALRHRMVVDALREAASRSQTTLLQHLETRRAEGAVQKFKPFWIVNGIAVTATVNAVRELVLRNDVDVIEVDLPVELIEPVETPVERHAPGELVRGVTITPGVLAIEADRVWNELGITGVGALVANMDTGVELVHPALSARWRGNFAPAAHCWRDAVGFGDPTPEDHHGHGTHVMGTICGLGPNDAIGVAPGALWIADNTINQGTGGAFDSDVTTGLQWFADPDGNSGTDDDVPDVVQNSWGVNEFFTGYVDCDSRWWAAIDNCEAAGVVITYSAGNEGPSSTSLRSPADRATSPYNAFSVGATIHSPPFTIASFSSRGPSGCGGAFAMKPEVCAPGVDTWSSVPGGGYSFLSGTSMAGPHVAGVVGLMRSANPDLDVQTVKQILMDTCTDLGPPGEENTYGHGFINAYEAVLASLSGYGTIEGTVTDAISGDPIADVAVDVLSDPRATSTDEDGFFRVLLPAGTWSLEFSFFGYETETVPFDVVAQQITDGDVALTLLPQAIVSGVVRDYTTALVQGATITALGTPLSSSTSLADGSYTLSVPAGGTYDIRARKNGFDAHVHNDVLVPGATTLDFVLPQLSKEDFESGNFQVWPWVMSGSSEWTIDSSVHHDGLFSARSGAINNNQSTSMQVTLPVASSGVISFWYQTSTEASFDLLRFYIDDVLKGTWSGNQPWTQATFAVANGSHVFRWTYSKNSSGTGGSDVAWIDEIQFPSIGFPEVSLSSNSLSATVPPEGTAQQTLTVFNTGIGQLDFLATVHGVASAIQAPASDVDPDATGTIPGGAEVRGAGGPDAFGYRWTDSDEPGGPVYQWVEISGVGQGLAMGDNTYSIALPLGFTFSFYGNNYTTVRVSANGFLSFTSPSGAYNLNSAIPAAVDPDNMVAAFWDDLNFLQGGTLHTYQDAANQRFIVQFANVPLAGSGGANRQTFQIILNLDGSIVTQYKSVSSPTSATVGIENLTGSDGLQVVFNGAYLHNNLAIRFATAPPVTWLTVSPFSGSIAPGGQADLDVDYDAAGLALGTYEALIRIATNDPDEAVINVPVTMTVQSATDVVTTVGLPTKFELAVAQPNPFSKNTSVRFAVPVQGQRVEISVFDVTGRRVRALVDGPQNAGYHVAGWDGRDEEGLRVTSGVYFYRMEAGSFEQVQKVTVLK